VRQDLRELRHDLGFYEAMNARSEKKVTLPRLAFMGDPDPHDWKAWALQSLNGKPWKVQKTRKRSLDDSPMTGS